MQKERFTVKIGQVEKNLVNLPQKVQDNFIALVHNLSLEGPQQPGWQNYTNFENIHYHRHLTPRHVACWRPEKTSQTIEVYYVGSREEAPY
ncbi:MAG: hypothetical protein GY750_06480 [Lentisphaerae bacterium]|nr:hypothetical protein [Lentisphaerota bacterium]MCP4101055.1 hypothetical protein [Lentisphaerota bacterium]